MEDQPGAKRGDFYCGTSELEFPVTATGSERLLFFENFVAKNTSEFQLDKWSSFFGRMLKSARVWFSTR